MDDNDGSRLGDIRYQSNFGVAATVLRPSSLLISVGRQIHNYFNEPYAQIVTPDAAQQMLDVEVDAQKVLVASQTLSENAVLLAEKDLPVARALLDDLKAQSNGSKISYEAALDTRNFAVDVLNDLQYVERYVEAVFKEAITQGDAREAQAAGDTLVELAPELVKAEQALSALRLT